MFKRSRALGITLIIVTAMCATYAYIQVCAVDALLMHEKPNYIELTQEELESLEKDRLEQIVSATFAKSIDYAESVDGAITWYRQQLIFFATLSFILSVTFAIFLWQFGDRTVK